MEFLAETVLFQQRQGFGDKEEQEFEPFSRFLLKSLEPFCRNGIGRKVFFRSYRSI